MNKPTTMYIFMKKNITNAINDPRNPRIKRDYLPVFST